MGRDVPAGLAEVVVTATRLPPAPSSGAGASTTVWTAACWTPRRN